MDENLDPEQLRRINELLATIGSSYEREIEWRTKGGKSAQTATMEIIKLSNGIAKATRDMHKSAADIQLSTKSLRESLNKGEYSAAELSEELDILRDQIKQTSDQDKKQALIEQKADLENINARNIANKSFTTSLTGIGATLTVGVGRAFADIAKTALNGGDSFAAASSVMGAGVDLVNSANQVGANSLKTFGLATAGAGGTIGRFGVVATVAGESLGALSNTVSDLAKAGIGFMISQTKQLISGFQTMSAAGAIYSGGMEEMTKTALYAGLTLDQFSKVVSSNSVNLASTGLGVSEASKRLAKIMDVNSPEGKKLRNGMFALGMSAEEQASAVATTMATMAGPSGKLRASNEAVQVSTAEYAKNLKLISDMTGQDAKARAEKVRQDNDTLAFNAYLNSLKPEERTRTKQAMDAMSELDARAFREKKNISPGNKCRYQCCQSK